MENLLGLGCPFFVPLHNSFVAFFLCYSAPSSYNLKIIEFLLIHLILVRSGIVALLMFLHPCRQQHILLFRFSGYDLNFKRFSDFLFMYMFEDYKEDWSQFLKGLFTIQRNTTWQFNFNWWPNGLESKLPKSLMEAMFPFLNPNTGMKLNLL